MDSKALLDMMDNCKSMMRMLEKQLKWLKSMAADAGIDTVPDRSRMFEAEASAMREDMDRMRQELMAKAEADRKRIMDQVRQATAQAGQAANMPLAPGGAALMPFGDSPWSGRRKDDD